MIQLGVEASMLPAIFWMAAATRCCRHSLPQMVNGAARVQGPEVAAGPPLPPPSPPGEPGGCVLKKPHSPAAW